MKYFLIAGEASGDLHASNLMCALNEQDSDAEFCFYGGDKMSVVGGTRLRHYKKIAFMGFIPVLMHIYTILRALKICKRFIISWHPDVVILVDYPGFNFSVAKFLHRDTTIPVFYYILPKVWAWKEHRVERLKKNVAECFSILPFEKSFFEVKHHCPIHYVGNPSVDEISTFKSKYKEKFEDFCQCHKLSCKPILALLPGSRIQEIKANLREMVLAVQPYKHKGYQIVVAGAPDISNSYYKKHLSGLNINFFDKDFHVLRNSTFQILSHAEAALVTSGTATLETALFRVPQVVCYSVSFGKIVRWLKPCFLKVKYISLVNLILNEKLIPELIGDEVNPKRMGFELSQMVQGGECRAKILKGYDKMIQRLGPEGAPKRAAEIMLDKLTIHRI